MSTWIRGGEHNIPAAEEGRFLMSEAADAWSTVIDNLCLAFPGSQMARKAEGHLDEIAAMWAGSLSDVPVEAIPGLQQRVMRGTTGWPAWKRDNPPGLGTFREAWEAWDYYAERQQPDDAPARHLALPAAPVKSGPCHEANVRQMALMHSRGQMVTCDCVSKHGIHPSCTLSHDKGTWICASHIPLRAYVEGDRREVEVLAPDCGFEWPVTDEKNAPCRSGKRWAQSSVDMASVSAAVGVAAPSVPNHRTPAKLSAIEIVAERFNYDLDRMEALQFAQLTGFLKHWANAGGSPETISEAEIIETFPAWLQAQENRIQQRGTML